MSAGVSARVHAIQADITTLAVDAVVNAANASLLGYPIAAAAPLALATVRAELPRHPGIAEVIFCCYAAADLEVYNRLLESGSTPAEG